MKKNKQTNKQTYNDCNRTIDKSEITYLETKEGRRQHDITPNKGCRTLAMATKERPGEGSLEITSIQSTYRIKYAPEDLLRMHKHISTRFALT